MNAEQALPYDLDAERAVLGACLLDRDAILVLAPTLKAEAFYHAQHAQIYSAIVACYQTRTPPDLVSVAAELRRAGHLDERDEPPAGALTRALLVDLANGAMTSVHAGYYAAIINRHAQRRQLIEAGQRMISRAYAADDDPATLAAETERELLTIARPTGRRGLRPISEAVDTVYERTKTGVTLGISTGLRDLDEVTGGLHPGRLYLLAGQPGHGKSALAGQIVYHMAKHLSRRCQVFSPEMLAEEWAARYIAVEAKLDNSLISNNDVSEYDLPAFMEGAGIVAALPIVIDDGTAPTMDDIRMTALQDAAENGPPAVVVIDPLLLIARPDPRQTDAAQIAAIEAACKTLARDLGAAVLLLHHLNEAGKLYQGGGKQADAVMFLEQPQISDPDAARKDSTEGIARLFIKKNRGGKAGQTLAFKFFGECTTFKDLDRYRILPGYGG